MSERKGDKICEVCVSNNFGRCFVRTTLNGSREDLRSLYLSLLSSNPTASSCPALDTIESELFDGELPETRPKFITPAVIIGLPVKRTFNQIGFDKEPHSLYEFFEVNAVPDSLREKIISYLEKERELKNPTNKDYRLLFEDNFKQSGFLNNPDSRIWLADLIRSIRLNGLV